MNDSSTASVSLRRGLVPLWAARDLSLLGNWVAFVALLAWTYRALESGRAAALLVVAWMLMPIFLRPIAAVLVSASNGWAVGAVALLLRAAALVPLLSVSFDDDLQTVLIVAFLASIPGAFVRASHAALLPAVVPPERLEGVRRGQLATRLLAMVAGATVAYYLFRADELWSVAIAAAAGFVLAGALTAMVRPADTVTPAKPRRSQLDSFRSSQRELARALRHPALQPIVAVYLLLTLLIGGEVVAKTAFVTWGLFMPNENLGFLLAAQGAGLLLALAIFRRARRRHAASTLAAGGVMLAALAEFGFSLTNDVPPAALFNLFVGLGFGLALLGLGSMFRAAGYDAHEGAGHDLVSGLAPAAGITVLASATIVGLSVDTITARFTIALISGMLVVLATYAFGALPVLNGDEEQSTRMAEGTLSSLLPD